MIPALVRAAESAQVTDWGPRIALTLLAAHGLITLGVVRRWQAEPAAPAALPIAGDVTIEAGAGPN